MLTGGRIVVKFLKNDLETVQKQAFAEFGDLEIRNPGIEVPADNKKVVGDEKYFLFRFLFGAFAWRNRNLRDKASRRIKPTTQTRLRGGIRGKAPYRDHQRLRLGAASELGSCLVH